MSSIKLQSSDGEIFVVDQEIARASQTIKTMMEILDPKDEEEVVPLANVTSSILSKIIDWATHHKDDPPKEEYDEENKRSLEIGDWDREFLNLDQTTLFDVVLAANYLDIKGLLDVSCKAVANMIRGKTPEEIREQFDLPNDLTPEEAEQIRKENEWCEEK